MIDPDTHLAADLGDGGAGFRLAQCEGDLFFGELRFFHDKPSCPDGLKFARNLYFSPLRFCGRRSFLREEVSQEEVK